MPMYDELMNRAGNLADVLIKQKAQATKIQAEKDKLDLEYENKQNALLNNQQRMMDEANRLGLKPGTYSTQISESGFSLNPENDDALSALIKGAQLQNLQEDRKERAIERYGKARVAAKIPELEQFNESAKQELTPEKIKNAYGGFLGRSSSLPVVGGMAQGLQEIVNPEAAKTRMVMEQVKSFPRHELFGATLSNLEKDAVELALGGGLTKQPELIQHAVNVLTRVAENKKKSIQSSYNPKIVQEYNTRMGIQPTEQQAAQQKTVIKTQTGKKTGRKRVVYSDGTSEIIK